MKPRATIQPLERWIDQYQFCGRRAMSSDEREFLFGQIVESCNTSNCMLIGLISSVLVALLGCSGIGVLDRNLFGPLLAFSIIISSIVPLQWVSQLKIYREALGDIQLGEVEIFRTAPTSLTESHIVYLPRSGRVLSRQGHFITDRLYVKVNGIAVGPTRVELPFPGQFVLDENHLSRVRCLNQAEKRELTTLLPKEHSWKWLFPLVLWAWTSIGVGYQLELGFSYMNAVRVLLLFISAASLTIYFIYRRQRIRRVQNDLRKGTVVCEQMGSYKFEHLAKSDLLWTIDSHPASWRKREAVSSWFCPTI